MLPFGNHDFRQLSRNGKLPVSCTRYATHARAQSSAVHLFLLEMEQHSKTRAELTIATAHCPFGKLPESANRLRSVCYQTAQRQILSSKIPCMGSSQS